jgi:hypothetical protein
MANPGCPFLSGLPVVLELPLGSKINSKSLSINEQGILVKCGTVDPQGPYQGASNVTFDNIRHKMGANINPGGYISFCGSGAVGNYKTDFVCLKKKK